MKRTFCDRCGEQCVNSTVDLRIEIHHHTSDLKYVGEDEYQPAELCKSCWDEVAEVLQPLVMYLRSKMTTHDVEDSDTAMRMQPQVHVIGEVPHD